MKSEHPLMGRVSWAEQVVSDGPEPGKMRRTIWLLAGCVALMMTGYGLIIPIFARRLGEMGAGVQELGLMIMAFALAQFLAAPWLGSVADRRGRRPLILLSLAAFVAINIGFLLARSPTTLIVVRALEGALTAGLFPAVMGVVADVVPENERGKWTGIVMGAHGAGFVLGPVAGGALYDSLGFAAPFIASAVMGGLALAAAAVFVPETRTAVLRKRKNLEERRDQARAQGPRDSWWTSLPRPLTVFGMLLLIDFLLIFAFAFVDPKMVFYLYDQLGWTTIQFGLVVAAYGSMIVIGQVFFGQLSDRWGRKPVILLGLVVHMTFYVGIAFITPFSLLLVVALIGGLGEALAMPAASAFYLDISSERHRSRVMGFKESAAALGGVAGPVLIVLIGEKSTPQTVFLMAFGLLLAAVVLGLVLLREPEKADSTGHPDYGQLALAAQDALRGIATRAGAARSAK